jgi:dTDP-4-amino-4,6-dideoxygalactose transaminase
MTSWRIPFNEPALVGNETRYVGEVMEHGHASGDGLFTRKCQTLLEELTGAPRALLTTSCTDALEMAALLLDIGPGDEVIVPAFTFVSTANAFALRGATIVFADVRPDTLNLDETRLEALITPQTKAIVPVHYAGVGCEMEAILAIARRYRVAVVEDNAHGLFGMYRGRELGSFGCLAAQSFHETKNISCGEGGALLVNEQRFVERAEIIREKGTNRSRFFRGQVDKYTWVDLGSSHLPSDILAAYLFAQLEAHATIQATRRAIWERYAHGLSDWAEHYGVRLPVVPEHCVQAYHMFYLLLETAARDALQGIYAVFHYQPLHLSPMGRRFGGIAGSCPVTEDISGRIVRLPFFNRLAASAQEEVIAAVKQFAPQQRIFPAAPPANFRKAA